MVLHVMKWNVHPEKAEVYINWAEMAIKRTVTPKVVEFRAYRPVTGNSQVVATYEFNDLTSWAEWQSDEEVKTVVNELRSLAYDINIEVWGPSPVADKPVYFY
jgi:hypothetical protein